MVPEPGAAPARTRLDSWKEIAVHLQRDVRTAQRWEKQEGLPVHRHMHGERGSVYAYTDELDQWWAQRQPPVEVVEPEAARTPWRTYAGLATLAVLLTAFAWFAVIRRPPPAPHPNRIGRLLAAATTEGKNQTTVPLEATPSMVIASPHGREVYVIHGGYDFISVLDTRTNRITAKIPTAPQASRAAISPDGAHLYVGSQLADLSVIDTATRVTRKIPTGGRVTDVAVTPDGKKVFLASEYSGLKRVTTATGEVATLPGTVCPMYLAMSAVGNRLYVSYQCGGPRGRPGHDSIDVVDVATERSVATIQGPPLVGGAVAVTPDGQHIWASAFDACVSSPYDHQGCPFTPADVFHLFRASDLSLIQTLAFPWVRSGVTWITPFPDGTRAVLTGAGVRVIDALRFSLLESLDASKPEDNYGQLAFSRDGRKAYLPRRAPNELLIIDVAPPACEPATIGLDSYWPADGATGDAHDGASAELKNGTGYAPGLVGQAFRLDGLNDFVRVHQNGGPLTRAEGTFSAWVKFDKIEHTMYIADRSFSNHEFGWRLLLEPPGRFQFCLAGGTGCISSSTLAAPGRWYHVAGVRTENNLILYVNGNNEGSRQLREPLAPVSLTDNPYFHLGASQQLSGFFHGLIDEVALYRRGLNAADIGQLIAAGRCMAGN